MAEPQRIHREAALDCYFGTTKRRTKLSLETRVWLETGSCRKYATWIVWRLDRFARCLAECQEQSIAEGRRLESEEL